MGMYGYKRGDYNASWRTDLNAIEEHIESLEERIEELIAARHRVWKILFDGFEPAEKTHGLSKRDFDLYEASLRPVERFTDVDAANDGYENLLYHGRAATRGTE